MYKNLEMDDIVLNKISTLLNTHIVAVDNIIIIMPSSSSHILRRIRRKRKKKKHNISIIIITAVNLDVPPAYLRHAVLSRNVQPLVLAPASEIPAGKGWKTWMVILPVEVKDDIIQRLKRPPLSRNRFRYVNTQLPPDDHPT